MATTGLEVFDRTLHTTNLWLDEINAEIGPDRHLAWHVLGAVLRTLRDEMQVDQSAHFAAQLPLLVRGAYFDQYRPAQQPAAIRSQDDFISRVQHDLDGARPVRAEQAVAAVMRTLNRHVTEGQLENVRDALPKAVRAMWPEPEHRKEPEEHKDSEQAPGQQKQAAQRRPAPQHATPQPLSPQQAAPHRPDPQAGTPQSWPKQAAPRPPAPQQAAPQSAQEPKPPQHVSPQSSLHPEPHTPARDWDDIDTEDETVEEVEELEPSRVGRGKRAQGPIGAASRPPAKFQAAPAAGTSSRKPKIRGNREDDQS
jgi:uncharacterized protein (DUF2267 family)